MSDYVPTTQSIRTAYALIADGRDEREALFDAWLTKHEADVRQAAHGNGQGQIVRIGKSKVPRKRGWTWRWEINYIPAYRLNGKSGYARTRIGAVLAIGRHLRRIGQNK